MRVLLVGAGAVGAVYARHLQKAGVLVAFLVKPHHVTAVKAGLTLYELHDRAVREPRSLFVETVLSTWDEVRRERFDQIWLTIPSHALTEAWLTELNAASGDATIVAMAPGLEAQELTQRHFDASRVVVGMIGVIAYQAPLPGEAVPTPGIAYYTSRWSPTRFGGEDAERAADALERGGCPAVVDAGVWEKLLLGSALLMPQLVGLERAGWSLSAFREDGVALATQAGKEARAAVARRIGVREGRLTGLAERLLTPTVFSAIWWLGPHILPFDLEAYLRYHFSKVHTQTAQILREYEREARAQGLSHEALSSLSAFVAEEG